MGESAIQALEVAAQVFLAAPNLVTPEQRRQAENVFHEFRSTKNPYQLCREILETSGSEYVLFEAASLIKTALIKEWELLSEPDTISLRQYMLEYLLNRDTPPFLKEKLIQTIAIIIKRGSLQDGGRKRKAFLTDLEKIIMNSPTPKHQKLACSIILAIMQEFTTTVKTADVGLAWEVHFRLKKNFEALELKRIFRFGVSALEQIVQVGPHPEGDVEVILKQLLTIVEMVLCWGQVSPLLTKRLIGAFEAIYESDQPPALRLPAIWKDTILQPALIALFFKIHMYVRLYPHLAISSLTCLVQLASLSGMIVTDMVVRKEYLVNYVKPFMNMLSTIQPNQREMLSFADIYRRLVQFFLPNMIATLPIDLLQNLTKLTVRCIEAAVLEESVSEDTIWKEALNKFMHTWNPLVQDTDGYSNEVLRDPCIEIFNKYLQCRLAPPDGTRCMQINESTEDIEIDMEEDERQQHAYVLAVLGNIARKAPAHCSHILFSLLQSRGKKLEEQLRIMYTGVMPISAGGAMLTLFDDLHWILMITGHFLSQDCVEGETLLIPSEIIQYSIRENANIEASLHYMVGESTSIENVDPILSLVGEILRISACECAALEAGLGPGYSPEVSATMSWLLKIWANSYLMHQTSFYTEMSTAIECAWGPESSGVSWVLSRLIQRAVTVLKHMTSLPPAPTQALQLLTTIAYIPDKKARLANSEEFLSLVAWEATGSNLPGHMRKELHRAFTVASTHATGDAKNRLEASTIALQTKLANLIAMENDTEPVRNMIADSLECLVGVIEGAREVSSMNKQCTQLMSSLESVPVLLYRYHNYPTVVLPAFQILTKCAKRLLHTMQVDNATKFLNICNTTFDCYGRWNSGKISSIAHDAEEEAYEDLCSLMELICSIARSTAIVDVHATCAAGLRLTLPLITAPLLSLPQLAHAAYKMLRDLESCDQLKHLPIEDFHTIINALRVGLTAVSCDVSALCCDTIIGLASKLLGSSEDNVYAKSLLSLSEILLVLILKRELPLDSIPSAGAAIYCLTCVRPVLFEEIARQLISMFSGNDPNLVQRLQDAFRALTNGVIFDGLRSNRLKFQENFDKFTTAVNAFLAVR